MTVAITNTQCGQWPSGSMLRSCHICQISTVPKCVSLVRYANKFGLYDTTAFAVHLLVFLPCLNRLLCLAFLWGNKENVWLTKIAFCSFHSGFILLLYGKRSCLFEPTRVGIYIHFSVWFMRLANKHKCVAHGPSAIECRHLSQSNRSVEERVSKLASKLTLSWVKFYRDFKLNNNKCFTMTFCRDIRSRDLFPP